MVFALTDISEPNVVKFRLGVTPVNVDFVGITRNLHCWFSSDLFFLGERPGLYIFFARGVSTYTVDLVSSSRC